MIEAVAAALARVRTERPLIHILSNEVTLGDVANAALAVGARPIMSQSEDEITEIVSSAQALVLNLGTPTRQRIQAMLLAGQAANTNSIPIVFDPVGVGASSFRFESANRILEQVKFDVIRGNAGEMARLTGMQGTTSGVDSAEMDAEPRQVLQNLASTYKAVAAQSGPVDYATDGSRLISVQNGTPLLQRISGAGDMLDAFIAAALAVETDTLVAAASGLVWMGVAAEMALAVEGTIGSFRVALFDALDELDEMTLLRASRISIASLS